MFTLAILAVAACALCNGVAAILQKIGADEQRKAKMLDAGLLLKLTHNAPFVGGVCLDLLGWILTVFAVRHIPLFLAQAIIASSVAVTALLDWLILRHRLPRAGRWSLALLLVGLVLLGLSAHSQHAVVVRGIVEWVIVVVPLVCLCLGRIVARSRSRMSALTLALLSGVAFGGTSVVGRVLPLSSSWWHVLEQPLFWSLVLDGLAGVLLFTIALQRGLATTINASMTAAETLIPTAVGLLFLGDVAHGGRWLYVVFGLACTMIGVVGVARASSLRH